MQYIEIKEILFKGKQHIPWKEVEKYAKRYVGKTFQNREYGDLIVVNSSFPDEYVNSKYTSNLRGALAKVKANLIQIIPELIKDAIDRRWLENKADKHDENAKGGWYRYEVYFSMKVDNNGEIKTNFYNATIVVRINDTGLYLYDIVNIKKEARKPMDS